MPIQISLKAARVNTGLTLVDAAKTMGISKEKLIKWERNSGLVNPINQRIVRRIIETP